jgi:hypothetical protein
MKHFKGDASYKRLGTSALTAVSRSALRSTQPPILWVPGVLSPGVKRGRSVTLTTHPHLVPRSRMSGAIPLPLIACMAIVGRLYFVLLYSSWYLDRGCRIIGRISRVCEALFKYNSSLNNINYKSF